MANKLFESAQRIMTERLRWETNQRRWYCMRHEGLPRKNRTGNWQADGHSKTIDRAMRKNKPFWLGQVTAGDRLANFTALKQQVQTLSDSAANFYDFITYHQTRLMDELDCAVDHMLLKGRGIIKSTIDPLNGYRIVDEAIDPMYLLMPESANDFEDADEWIHIRLFTVAAYKRLDDRWNKEADTLTRIRGSKDFQTLGIYQQQIQLREGITHTTNANYILVFEHWEKTAGGHTIHVYSPHSPEIPLRQSHGNPYKFGDKESIPFTSFQMEIKDKGWYAPRGLGELLDVQEQKETFIENQWADAMTMANNPPLTGDKEIMNTANLRWERNQYIGGNVRPIQVSPPAIPYETMLNYSRGISEEISQAPDAGITSPDSKTGGKPITAAESNRVGALMQVGSNYNADIFRRRLGRLHQHRWGLICQFKERDFSYYAAGELNTLPEQALHDKYMIVPDGSPDGWNRGARLQREIALMQTFAGLPNSDPDYWTKRAMNACDGQAGLQGFVPVGLKGATEYENQAFEILALTADPPFPVKPQPQQDQPSRIKCIIDWMQAAGKLGKPVSSAARNAVQQNLVARLQILQQQNPAAAKEIKMLIQQMEQQPVQPMTMPDRGGAPPVNGQPQPAMV